MFAHYEAKLCPPLQKFEKGGIWRVMQRLRLFLRPGGKASVCGRRGVESLHTMGAQDGFEPIGKRERRGTGRFSRRKKPAGQYKAQYAKVSGE